MAENLLNRVWKHASFKKARSRYADEASVARDLTDFGKMEKRLLKAKKEDNYWSARLRLEKKSAGNASKEYDAARQERDEKIVKAWREKQPVKRFSLHSFFDNHSSFINAAPKEAIARSRLNPLRLADFLKGYLRQRWLEANAERARYSSKLGEANLEQARGRVFNFVKNVEDSLVSLAENRAAGMAPPETRQVGPLAALAGAKEGLERTKRTRSGGRGAALASYAKNLVDFQHEKRVFPSFEPKKNPWNENGASRRDIEYLWEQAYSHHLSNYSRVLQLLEQSHGKAAFARIFGPQTLESLCLPEKTVSDVIGCIKPTEKQLLDADYSRKQVKKHLQGEVRFSQLKQGDRRQSLFEDLTQNVSLRDVSRQLKQSGVAATERQKLLSVVSSALIGSRKKLLEHRIGAQLETARYKRLASEDSASSAVEPGWVQLADPENHSTEIEFRRERLPLGKAIVKHGLFTRSGVNSEVERKLLAALRRAKDANDKKEKPREKANGAEASTYALKP